MTRTFYGLPYCGSKQRFAKRIADAMPAPTKRFVELFAGGAALSDLIGERHRCSILLNDVLPIPRNFVALKAMNRFCVAPAFCSREKFYAMRDQNDASSWLTRVLFSFATFGTTYFAGEQIDEGAARDAYNFATTGYSGSRFGLDDDPEGGSCARACRRRLAALKTIATISSFQAPITRWIRCADLAERECGPVEVSAKDFEDVSLEDGDLVYADPPYQSSDRRSYAGHVFDIDRLWSFCRRATVPIFVSSRTAPKDFVNLIEFPAARFKAAGRSTLESVFVNQKWR